METEDYIEELDIMLQEIKDEFYSLSAQIEYSDFDVIDIYKRSFFRKVEEFDSFRGKPKFKVLHESSFARDLDISDELKTLWSITKKSSYEEIPQSEIEEIENSLYEVEEKLDSEDLLNYFIEEIDA